MVLDEMRRIVPIAAFGVFEQSGKLEIAMLAVRERLFKTAKCGLKGCKCCSLQDFDWKATNVLILDSSICVSWKNRNTANKTVESSGKAAK